MDVPARADYFMPQHWLIGSLEAGEAPTPDNHEVFGYYPASRESQVTDRSGAAGSSGLPGRFMLNSYEIPGVIYLPGMVLSVEVDGLYRAGPAGLAGSAAGYDLVPFMTLTRAMTLEIMAIAESGVNLRDGDFFSETPRLSIKLIDPNIKGRIAGCRITLKRAATKAEVMITEAAGLPDEFLFQETIPYGLYDLTALVWDAGGNRGEKTVELLQVTPEKKALEFALDRTVWRAKKGETLTMSYNLSRDMEVMLYGISVSGEIVKTYHAAAGTMGGRAGYNRITLSGTTTRGSLLGNGIYVIQLTSGPKLLGKFKIVVAD